jgi:hypothetical protein
MMWVERRACLEGRSGQQGAHSNACEREFKTACEREFKTACGRAGFNILDKNGDGFIT